MKAATDLATAMRPFAASATSTVTRELPPPFDCRDCRDCGSATASRSMVKS